MTILVTGGTGSLGRPTVELLRAAGNDVRVFSRTRGPGRVTGNLTSGEGLAEALDGVHTVLHLATSAASGKDAAQTRRLLDASLAAGVAHFVYISIVGVDVNPYPYYRIKFACERAISESGIPHTILRATQFHSFLAMLVSAQRRFPFILAADIPVQPIAGEEVAARLVELVGAAPAGAVPDIGGPEQLRLLDAIATLQAAAGTHKRVWALPLAGRTIRAFRSGTHMPGLPGFGRETFAEYVQRVVR
ncbi:NmrA family NAD(P)-binding protein [Salinibacterium sp. G-O1]|uniref:SDR family oxidoreductase n=1 Tax=Salinibacterium sp. G-O1 TaxID=3046208 RepID=UPI0024B8ABEC|nr:NmrA family NAD(P)-binding protein [Salinibacterium sp. G-O1]MDJ0335411.1 NmrA family NAD(P)-binding protein [Salinibacterium sp. G-O1]